MIAGFVLDACFETEAPILPAQFRESALPLNWFLVSFSISLISVSLMLMGNISLSTDDIQVLGFPH